MDFCDYPISHSLIGLLVWGLCIGGADRVVRKDRSGFLAAVWIASVAGPVPSSERTVAISGLAMWLFVPCGYWIDRHRVIVRAKARG